ncbi:hypothetical protein [Streptomyces pseudogriseolus]|uniref:hypothetical protein n=1 Tax=Streptomyces pseudogriseolus TaxID=36817 RepID=UPI00364E9F22
MTVPNPWGCRLCGIDRRPHGIQATSNGSHAWQPPTQQQIKTRMLARRAERGVVPIPEYILNSQCPHGLLYQNCQEAECNNYLREVEESATVDNSAEAWEEDWDDSPQLGGMGEELRQEYGELFTGPQRETRDQLPSHPCGWNPAQASTGCDFDKDCPVHGAEESPRT